MNDQVEYIEYIKYLKTLTKHLQAVVKKIEQKKDIDDDDREVIKATIQAFLKTEKEL